MIKIFSKLMLACVLGCCWASLAQAQTADSRSDRDEWSIEEDQFLRELGIIDDLFWGFSVFENQLLNDLLRALPGEEDPFAPRRVKPRQSPKNLLPPENLLPPAPATGPSNNALGKPASELPVPKKLEPKAGPNPAPSSEDMDDFIEAIMKELTNPKPLLFDDKLKMAQRAIGWR